jgi:hypothetical protein
LPAFPSSNLITRDNKGRFRTPNQEERLPLIALSKKVMDPLIGNLLGDGSLQINKKGQDGKPKLNCNAIYTMTLKDKTYTYYLWGTIYSSICTKTIPSPWPNPKTGKSASRYNFKTKSLPSLTLLHSQWYQWSGLNKRLIKIVPLNIE